MDEQKPKLGMGDVKLADREMYEKDRSDKEEKLQRFLEIMGQLESSGGLNTDHETMSSGIHKGASAFGTYGLMPNSIRELANRAGLSGSPDIDITQMRKLSDEDIKARLSQDPDLEQKFARKMAERVLGVNKGDEVRASHSWQFGHNKEGKEDSERANRFKRIKDSMRIPASIPVKLK